MNRCHDGNPVCHTCIDVGWCADCGRRRSVDYSPKCKYCVR